MFKKSLLLILIVVLAMFSCKLPNSSSAASKSIIERYPHWNVRISEFMIDDYPNRTEEEREKIKNMKLSIEEKQFAVKALALMKLVINTPEFEKAVMEAKDVYAHKAGEVANGAYNIKSNEIHSKILDKKRLLQIIKGADFSAIYLKIVKPGIFRGTLGDLAYAHYGYGKFKYGNRVEGSYTRYEESNKSLAYFAASAFHEHLHNLGFNHTNNKVADVPYTIGTNVFRGVANKITGEDSSDPVIREKYANDLQELTDYYLKMYEHFFKNETVYTGKKSGLSADERDLAVCSHS